MSDTVIDASCDREIDPALVFDYDYFNDARFDEMDDPHQVLLSLQQSAPPVFWSPALGGYWVIQGYAQVFEASRATDLFSSAKMRIPADPVLDGAEPAIPINLDAPIHMKYRRPLNLVFSPKAMHALEGEIRELAVELIAAVRDEGRCDFMPAVAEPLPVVTFMRLMGMDLSRLKEFRDLAHGATVNPDPDVRKAASLDVARVMTDVVGAEYERQAAGAPVDNVIARLMNVEIDGERISRADLEGYCRLLFFAGLDTVANAMGFGVAALAGRPDLQARLRKNPADIPWAVEELLRLKAPTSPARYVTRDQEWHGVTLRAGDRALLVLPGANLDERMFPRPEEIDFDRGSIPHAAFNTGPHRCVGAHLARIELRVMYEEWLSTIPEFRLDPSRSPAFHSGMVMGYDSLHLLWD